jgi:hypothetical protein
VRALVNAIRADMLVPGGVRATAFLETIALGALARAERDAFVHSVFLDPYWSEIAVVSAPATGPADDDLAAWGFVPSAQEFDLFWLPFGALEIAPVRSFHLDLL